MRTSLSRPKDYASGDMVAASLNLVSEPSDEGSELQLLMHIGPHKTGTTSIQALLHAERDALRDGGYFYPLGEVYEMAHHEVVFSVLERDLRLLGAVDNSYGLANSLANWLAEARICDARTMLLSAEGFSWFQENDWKSFFKQLDRAENQSGVRVSEIRLAVTERNVQARERSWATEALKHGCKLDYELRITKVRDLMLRTSEVLARLPTISEKPISFISTRFDDDKTPGSFLERWVSQVLGSDVACKISAELYLADLNPPLSQFAQEQLLDFNKTNSPDSSNPLMPFVDLLENRAKPSRLIAHQRLAKFLSVLMALENAQRERLAAESVQRTLSQTLDALKNSSNLAEAMQASRSWRVTKPLRYLARQFRRF